MKKLRELCLLICVVVMMASTVRGVEKESVVEHKKRQLKEAGIYIGGEEERELREVKEIANNINVNPNVVRPTVLGTPWLNMEDTAGMKVIEVTSSGDSGEGTLREAIDRAHREGGNTWIKFRLNKQDAGYEQATGTWRIKLKSTLLITTDRIFIDGLSQGEYGGETNPKGPEIIIDGTGFSDTFLDGFSLVINLSDILIYKGNQNWIRGLCFIPNRNEDLMGAIGCSAEDVSMPSVGNRFNDNFVGINPDGETLPSGDCHGIDIRDGSQDTLVEGNTICSSGAGIIFFGGYKKRDGTFSSALTTRNIIKGNKIGTNVGGTKRIAPVVFRNGFGMPMLPVMIFDSLVQKNIIEENIIAGSRGGGIGQLNDIGDDSARFNIIRNNRIGVGIGGENIGPEVGVDNQLNPDLDKGAYAIGILATVGDEVEGNIIGNFALSGIQVRNCAGDPTIREATKVIGNEITNSGVGIQVGETKGAVIEGNKISKCSVAGVAIVDDVLDAAHLYVPLGETLNKTLLPTINVEVKGNTFIEVRGPKIGLTKSVKGLMKGDYVANAETKLQMSGPNLYQPTPEIVEVKRKENGEIEVRGKTVGGGILELYEGGRVLAKEEVKGEEFRVVMGAEVGGKVRQIGATVTVNNQTSEMSREVEVKEEEDREKPEVKVIAPGGGEIVSEEGAVIKVVWEAKDNRGIERQKIKLRGKRKGIEIEEEIEGLRGEVRSYEIKIKKGDEVEGVKVVVEAEDKAGNKGEGESVLFTIVAPKPIDKEKPEVTEVILSKKKVVRKKDGVLEIRWKARDNVGVVEQRIMYAGDGINFTREVVRGLRGEIEGFKWTIPGEVEKTKTGRIKVIARDEAGNEGEGVSVETVVVK